jgi:uncharacterized protein (DUF2267 family)
MTAERFGQAEQHSRILERVADKSDLEPRDAESLVNEFLRVISEFVDPQAWRLMNEITAADLDIADMSQRPEGQRTIKEFLLELSDEEGVTDPRGATHARAVAETILENATPEQVEELSELLDDDFLALFETLERGELTDVDLPESWQE